jgi:hypothetical protein
MPLLPENHADRIAFFTSRTALWNTNATVIGTTTTQVTAVTTAATAASAALAAQILAQNTAKSATETLLEAMATLTNAGNIVIEQVRTKARTAGDSVYPLANIPVPATPSPVGPPGTPTDLKVALNPDGSLELKWKCPNPAGSHGTLYHVFRSTTGETADYQFVGGAGERKFIDSTFPSGASILYYKIQAVRTTAMGVAGEFLVRFGTGSSGITVTAIAPKLAA